jgi:transcriptional regulator with XRE-family HTH domain
MGRKPRPLNPGESFAAHFGSELRAYRLAANLTQEQLGAKVGYTGQMIGQVELGQATPSQKLCENLDQLFKTNGNFIRMWKVIAREGNVAWFRDYIERESRANKVRKYEAQLIPGLLQTEDYIRSLVRSRRLSHDVERYVAARMARQAILTGDDPAQFWFVIDEAGLQRQFGGRDVMRDQLKRLIELFELPNVHIRILPFTSAIAAAVDGAFIILTFEDEPEVVYHEALEHPRWIESPDGVATCEVRWELIIAEALPSDASLRHLAALLEEI